MMKTSYRKGDRPGTIAFVLPQFHRIPENDAWWGEGFTEWVNVRKAKPQFRGHLQPRVPLNANYYDLCDESTQAWQAELAREHGISGFCYYHYWFNGKRLLERPVQLMLERNSPDMPFCLAWANEPWTRAWDGGEREVLMPQEYGGPEEWRQHFDALLAAFNDRRYIRLDGKPVFLIYRSTSVPSAPDMLLHWRKWAEQAGLPGLHLVEMLTAFPQEQRPGLFDARVDFEPMRTMYHHLSKWVRRRDTWARHRAKVVKWLTGEAPHGPNTFHYARVWESIKNRTVAADHYPGVFVDWDNSPRRPVGSSIIFRGFSEDIFEEGLSVQYRKAVECGAPFVFINAWNEWAEGTYLEPDAARGTRLLEIVSRATRLHR